jgi:hypothetical protein
VPPEDVFALVHKGKSKKSKGKRKKEYFMGFSGILDGLFIYVELY